MSEKIAIIGVSALFPGSETLEGFWNNLMEKNDLTSLSVSEDFGVDPNMFFNEKRGVLDRCYSTRGGYIRSFEFDALGFIGDKKHLQKLDSLYQWGLHVAREALINGGYFNNKRILEGCGLILGNLSFPTRSTHKILASIYSNTAEKALKKLINDKNINVPSTKLPIPENNPLQGNASLVIKNAIGLGCTHMDIDAACSSSLYAIKLACDELITGKADMMLAGAVSGSDPMFIQMGFSIYQANAGNSEKYKPLDLQSKGLIPSEGAGMVLLKRLSDAEKDGDSILGVISGVGLSNDGKGKFILSPNSKGQRLAFERAYKQNDILPQNSTYIECHATGTPLGDMTELNSIEEFFFENKDKLHLGSVKSNLGHLLTAAGMTSLTKVLLSFKHNILPPEIELEQPIKSKDNWFGKNNVFEKPEKWTSKSKQIGINAFGFGGANAHLVVNNYQKPINRKASKPVTLVQMAITGMDVHFGACTNLNAFYETIFNNKQHFRPLPKTRWNGFEENYDLQKDFEFNNGNYPPKGNFIEDFEFDILRYKIQPKDIETTVPQQALILKVADRAIVDAGLKEGTNVAVLIAMKPEMGLHSSLARWDSEWQFKEALKDSNLNENEIASLTEEFKNNRYECNGEQLPSQYTSIVGNLMASRIASLWDFTGPTFTVTDNNNGVLKALEVAQNMLSLGQVDAVVLGGVDFSGGLEHVLTRNKQEKINNSQNHGLSINFASNGWEIGEGAGVIVLKNSKKTTDDERIYSIIEKIGVLDSKKNIGYQELSASGFKAEDEKETLDLIKENPQHLVALGSVKANIGHTFAASLIASIIKTALCIYHKFIPGIPNWQYAKELEKFRKTNYYFPTTSRPWIKNSIVKYRKGLINSYGDSKILLAEYNTRSEKVKDWTVLQKLSPVLIQIKGNNKDQLETQLGELEKLIASNGFRNAATIYYHSYKNSIGKYSAVLVGNSEKSILRDLVYFKNNLGKSINSNQIIKTPSGSYFTPLPSSDYGDIAFVFPGSATSYKGLGTDLFQLFPNLLPVYETMIPNLEMYSGEEYLYPKTQSIHDKEEPIQNDAIMMMSVGVSYSSFFANILQHNFKIKPKAAFGYSMGECSSMWYAMGVWNPLGAKSFQNSPIFKNKFSGNMELLSKEWNMSSEEAKKKWISLILLTDKSSVEPLITQYNKVFLTFINSDAELIISGDKEQVQQVVKQLNCVRIEVPFQNVIHHDFCSKEEEGLIEMHSLKIETKPDVDFYSSLTGDKIEIDKHTIAKNSARVCYTPVDFPSIVKKVAANSISTFIEVGPASTCTPWIQDILKDQNHLAVPIDKKGMSSAQSILECIAQLVSNGVEVDLSVLYPEKPNIENNKTFIKKVIPGGKRIFDAFLTDEMKNKFKHVNDRAENVRSEELNSDKKNHVKINGSEKIGENGLKIHDFNDKSHLKNKTIIFSEEDLNEFAHGKIAKVFGAEYEIIDTYKRRVMLPMHPYLLVSRVTGLNAKIGEFKRSTIQTEYDVPHNSWFTRDKQVTFAIAVESGQCDLLLISYLGIDFQNKGEYVYRLLDCTLTFVDDLPYEGQTLRYDIVINSFVRSGKNLLFFFSYKCYVEDRLVLIMEDGCAGFFKDDQLSVGNGVVYTAKELSALENIQKRTFTPLLTTQKKNI